MRIDTQGQEKSEPLVIPQVAHKGHVVTHIVAGPPRLKKDIFDHLRDGALYFLKFSLFLLFLACMSDYFQW